jgi:ribosomal-protein-alanine N-acetyltransferase
MAVRKFESDRGSLPEWRVGLPQLVSERVTLREFRPTDAAALYRAATDPEVIRHMWPPPPTVEAVSRFIKRTRMRRAAGEYVCYAVVPQGERDVIGLFELRPLQPAFFRVELGYFMTPQWWGTGVFRDGMRLICDFAFNGLGVHRIEARCSVENLRGNEALRKIGAQWEGRLHKAFVWDGRYIDQYLWALVNEPTRSLDSRACPAGGSLTTVAR